MVLFLISGNWHGLWILEQLVATPLDFGNHENISNLRWQIKFWKLIINFNKLKSILPFIALISFVKISSQFPQIMAISWYIFIQKIDTALRFGISLLWLFVRFFTFRLVSMILPLVFMLTLHKHIILRLLPNNFVKNFIGSPFHDC